MEIAHPIGVIGAITPATNPTVTPLGNFMHALKGKNALVVCPAPRAQKTSTHTIELMREALVANGAPADLVQAVEEPTLEHSAQLMAECDLVLATGAFGLTKAAYSSGTPAYGVGPGNPPVVQMCIRDSGMEIRVLTPEEKQVWMDAATVLDDTIVAKYGQELLDLARSFNQ